MRDLLVILDRDGVLNRPPYGGYVARREEWQWIPGSEEALAELKRECVVAVATNQSAIGRGLLTRERLVEIHDEFVGRSVDLHYCPHLPTDECACRKPKTLMLDRILAELGFDRASAVFVGDSHTDVAAARSAGITPIRIGAPVDVTVSFADLRSVVKFLKNGGLPLLKILEKSR